MYKGSSPKTRYTGTFADDHRVETEWVNWRCWFPFILATIFIGTVLIVLVLWWGSYAYFHINPTEATQTYYASAFLDPGKRLHLLSSAGAPLQLTLLANLSPYLHQTHTIVSTTAQPHTIVIQGGGGASWNAPATTLTATFGGAINDGFEFTVISATQIHVLSNTNVAFS